MLGLADFREITETASCKIEVLNSQETFLIEKRKYKNNTLQCNRQDNGKMMRLKRRELFKGKERDLALKSWSVRGLKPTSMIKKKHPGKKLMCLVMA